MQAVQTFYQSDFHGAQDSALPFHRGRKLQLGQSQIRRQSTPVFHGLVVRVSGNIVQCVALAEALLSQPFIHDVGIDES